MGKWGLLCFLHVFIYWFYLWVLNYSNVISSYIFKLSLNHCIKLSVFFNFLSFSIITNILLTFWLGHVFDILISFVLITIEFLLWLSLVPSVTHARQSIKLAENYWKCGHVNLFFQLSIVYFSLACIVEYHKGKRAWFI